MDSRQNLVTPGRVSAPRNNGGWGGPTSPDELPSPGRVTGGAKLPAEATQSQDDLGPCVCAVGWWGGAGGVGGGGIILKRGDPYWAAERR